MSVLLHFAHMADYVTRDFQGKLIVLGIFEAIQDHMGVRPIPFPGFHLVVGLSASVADGTDHVLEIRVIDGNGDEVGQRQQVPFQLRTNGQGYRMRGVIDLQIAPGGLSVPELGDYEFRFLVGGEDIGGADIVVQAPLPPPE
jgi:hypothetical protein